MPERYEIPKADMAELCAKVDTIGAIDHVAECYGIHLTQIQDMPELGRAYSRLVFTDGAGGRGTIIFCEGQRKAARRAARRQA